jgi:AcrR family transcriptional regulator
MARRYRSEVREERARATRRALLDACEALLTEGPVEAVTIPALARRAGVTKPTAYSHFPDPDALLAGFLAHLRDRIGMDHATLAAIPPAGLPGAARDNYRRFEASEVVLRRVMDSPSYERVRLARKVDRAGTVLPAWEAALPERVLRRRLGAVYLLLAPASWRWLRDTWGLSGEDAAEAAAWAVETLAAAIPPRKKRAKERRS